MPNEKAQIVVKTIPLNDGTVTTVYFITLKEATLTTLRLPISAEESMTLSQMKLVLISNDGTFFEIEFEIVGDEIVFQTTESGAFIFIPMIV